MLLSYLLKTKQMTTRYKVGDTFMGKDVYRFGDHTWMHVYEVIAVEDGVRFQKRTNS